MQCWHCASTHYNIRPSLQIRSLLKELLARVGLDERVDCQLNHTSSEIASNYQFSYYKFATD